MVDHNLFTSSILLENPLNIPFRNQSILDCDPEEGTERMFDEEAFDDIEDLWGSLALNKINALLSLQHSVNWEFSNSEFQHSELLNSEFSNSQFSNS